MPKFLKALSVVGLAAGLFAGSAAAQSNNAVGGAIVGGAAGAIIGGAVGGGRGAAIGAIVGAGTGAAVAAHGEARRGGYYYYDRGCYLQRPDGAWVRYPRRYCEY